IIRNTVFGGNVNVDKIASLALYHDTAEVVSGDLPTPVKYYNSSMKGAYSEIEDMINKRLLDSLPDELREQYGEYVKPDEESEEYKLMKIADKLSAYVKCSEEKLLGNMEFDKAFNRLQKVLDETKVDYPELGYFLDNFMDGFNASVDIL
ncbi:MAG: 5'-deoxynucleotidase, partial [Clostridia bacterium]|nr:5'-deoxynucleotidase [Clostridia bacterium]